MAVIAEQAGVSKTTVSLALRNHPSIPAATCQRIQELAARVGYRPDPFVAALMANCRRNRPVTQTALIAYVTGYGVAETRQSSFLRRHYQGAQDRASQLGYKLEVFSMAAARMTSRRLSEILYARAIHGVLVGPFPKPHSELALAWEKFAPATIGFALERPAMSRVDNDHVINMHTAVQALRTAGYRRIGLCMYAEGEELAQYRNRMAYLNAHYAMPKRHQVPLCEPEIFDRERVLAWFHQHRPEVVLSINTEVRDWLQEAGLRVPDDVGFASLNLPAEEVGRISGILNNYEQVAASAVDLIEEALHRNERGLPASPKLILMNGAWVPGQTTHGRDRLTAAPFEPNRWEGRQ